MRLGAREPSFCVPATTTSRRSVEGWRSNEDCVPNPARFVFRHVNRVSLRNDGDSHVDRRARLRRNVYVIRRRRPRLQPGHETDQLVWRIATHAYRTRSPHSYSRGRRKESTMIDNSVVPPLRSHRKRALFWSLALIGLAMVVFFA